MPWVEVNAVDMRHSFVKRAMREEMPFKHLCDEFNISPKTGYKWKQQYDRLGLTGLVDASRRPKKCCNGLPEEVVCRLVSIKKEHETWGPAKVLDLFKKANPALLAPSISSVQRVLGKAGLVQKRPRRRRPEDCGRLADPVEATAPNVVWSIDFKGWWYSSLRERVEPLTVCDSFSRFVLQAQHVPDSTTLTVQRCLDALFTRYGLPLVIRSDNGSPFASSNAPLGLTRLAVWLLSLGISLDRIQPGHPEQNGRHERMHRDIAMEVERRVKGDLAAQQAALDVWRETYNNERPHSALGMRVPADLYVASSRRYDPVLTQPDYPAGFCRRVVSSCGCIRLNGDRPLISSALAGWEVGLQLQGEGTFNVWFAALRIGILNVKDAKFVAARAALDYTVEGGAGRKSIKRQRLLLPMS